MGVAPRGTSGAPRDARRGFVLAGAGRLADSNAVEGGSPREVARAV